MDMRTRKKLKKKIAKKLKKVLATENQDSETGIEKEKEVKY